MPKATAEEVAKAAWGEPVKRQGTELLWHCPHPERHNHQDRNPSLGVNPQKNLWKCWSEDVGGTGGWSLAAFIAGVGPADKPAVKSWLREQGLISASRCKSRAGGGRGGYPPKTMQQLHTLQIHNRIKKLALQEAMQHLRTPMQHRNSLRA
jgi:hypothetical protein